MNTRAELQRWIDGRRAAEIREREELRRNPPSGSRAFRQGTALIQLAASRHGWPLPSDASQQADDLAYHLTWAALRRRLRQL